MRELIGFWFPFAFTAFLCAMVMHGRLTGSDTGLPAFYCFLPFAFFHLGVAHMETSKRVRSLEARVKQLEDGRQDIA
jgi:hypothetical protein